MGGTIMSPQRPMFTEDVGQGSKIVSASETVNIDTNVYVVDEASRTVIIQLTESPILELNTGLVGSYWGNQKNLQYKAKGQTLVETDGSATFDVYDSAINLEDIFESSTNGRYVAKVTDGAGKVLYGWIGAVSVASDVYTFAVHTNVVLGTQNWFQGDATTFDAATGFTVEIYRYTTSLTWSASDTFSEEVPWNEPENPDHTGQSEFRLLASLTDGQYAVDYNEGRIYARKLDADNSEVATYKTKANATALIDSADLEDIAASITGPSAPVIDSYQQVAINLTTGANQVLVASAASKQIWVYGYGFTCGDADGQTVSLQDEDDTALTGIMEFGQYGGISVPPSGNFSMPVLKLATDKDLEIDITGGDVDGFLCYALVSV